MEPIELGVLVVIMLGPVVLAWYVYRWAHRASDERRGHVQSSEYGRRADGDISGRGGEGGAGSDGGMAGFSGGGGDIGDFGGGDGGGGGE